VLLSPLPLGIARAFAVALLGGAAPWLLHAHARELIALEQRYERALARDLAYLRLGQRARPIALLQLGLFALLVGCAMMKAYGLASVLLTLAAAPRPWLRFQRARRTTQIEAQLDGWLFGLASVLRATPAPGQAIEYSLALVVPPLREELETLRKEQRLGSALDEALSRMGARIGSRALQSALGTLRIGQASGGDLPDILERSAATLREMARLEGVIRTKTAESKAQAWLLVVLPFPLIALVHWLDPSFLAPLLHGLRGALVLAAALFLWLASIFVARRILDVDI
jgi:tight adherence protein B